VIAGAPKKMSAVFIWLLKIFARSLLLRQNFKFLIANINRDDLTTFGELITAGKVTPVIDRRYPLSGTADAMAYAEEGHARAKVVITFE
jgi:NADPH:quinone reductase-like Zn-dependent oxidoreductase